MSFYHSVNANVNRRRRQRSLEGIQQWNIVQDGRSWTRKVFLFYCGEGCPETSV